MGARNLRTSPLDLRIVLPLRVNLLRFVQKVLALGVITQGTGAKGAPSRRSSQLPRRTRAAYRRMGRGGRRHPRRVDGSHDPRLPDGVVEEGGGGAFPEQLAALRDKGFELVTYERKP